MDIDGHLALTPGSLFNPMKSSIADLAGPCHSPRSYHRGELIFQQGDIVEDCLVVVEGGVKIHRERPDGEHVVVAVISEGEAYFEPAMFNGDSSQVSAEAISPSRVMRISCKFLRRAAERRPLLAFEILAAISDQYNRLVEQVEQLRAQSVTQRIADFLLKMLQRTSGSAELALPYEKSLIANCLGTKPESFSRALVKMREMGVHVERNVVRISDVGRLVEHVGWSEPEHAVQRVGTQCREPGPFVSEIVRAWASDRGDIASRPAGGAGLATEQSFNAALAAEWRESIDSGAPISLLLVNIGQLEQLNDRQLAWQDGFVTAVGEAIMEAGRGRDKLIAHYGDDAFAVALPATDPGAARRLAKKIQSAIETSAMIRAQNGGNQRLAVSVGMATIVPTRMDRIEKIVCFADIALYRAKASNRGNACAFHDGPSCSNAKRSPSGGVPIPVIQSAHCAECRRDAAHA